VFSDLLGVGRASRNSSRLQGRHRLARNSHLAASPLLSGARPPLNLEQVPHGSQSRAHHILSCIASAAAENVRSLSRDILCRGRFPYSPPSRRYNLVQEQTETRPPATPPTR
jgi:hypothetical protein